MWYLNRSWRVLFVPKGNCFFMFGEKLQPKGPVREQRNVRRRRNNLSYFANQQNGALTLRPLKLRRRDTTTQICITSLNCMTQKRFYHMTLLVKTVPWFNVHHWFKVDVLPLVTRRPPSFTWIVACLTAFLLILWGNENIEMFSDSAENLIPDSLQNFNNLLLL
jgi:hypothetical protein